MTQGFFSKKEIESSSRPDGKVYSCTSCGLLKNSINPMMKPSGEFKKGILIVLDSPSKTEGESNIPLSDKAGRKIKTVLKQFGIDVYEDCLITYALRCNPDSRKGSLTYEISCCRRFLLKTIEEFQPKLILAFGESAVFSIIGHRWKKDFGTIQKWRGWVIPDQDLKTWICPVYDAQFVLHREEEVSTIWNQDIQRAISYVNKPLKKWKHPNVKIISDLSFLEKITSGPIAIDYETTGLKPHAEGHRIICISVAYSPDDAYVFLMPSRKERQPFLNLLTNPRIGKLAQNIKFEDSWTVSRLKTQIIGWEWDSMLAAHILDNREGITGLKFQTYVRFGIIDYSSEIEAYLQGKDPKNSNSLNRVDELISTKSGQEKLLNYCAMDTIVQYRLSMLQIKEMNYTFLPF